MVLPFAALKINSGIRTMGIVYLSASLFQVSSHGACIHPLRSVKPFSAFSVCEGYGLRPGILACIQAFYIFC